MFEKNKPRFEILKQFEKEYHQNYAITLVALSKALIEAMKVSYDKKK